jgi:hypothetical protein
MRLWYTCLIVLPNDEVISCFVVASLSVLSVRIQLEPGWTRTVLLSSLSRCRQDKHRTNHCTTRNKQSIARVCHVGGTCAKYICQNVCEYVGGISLSMCDVMTVVNKTVMRTYPRVLNGPKHNANLQCNANSPSPSPNTNSLSSSPST